MFVYCGNNPVNRIDPTGEAWWHWALGAAAVAACAAVLEIGWGQNTIAGVKVPANMMNQFYTGGVDTVIFRSGRLTVYGNQLAAFHRAVGGTIKFMP